MNAHKTQCIYCYSAFENTNIRWLAELDTSNIADVLIIEYVDTQYPLAVILLHSMRTGAQCVKQEIPIQYLASVL